MTASRVFADIQIFDLTTIVLRPTGNRLSDFPITMVN